MAVRYLTPCSRPTIDVIGDFGEAITPQIWKFLIGQVTADDAIPYDGRRVTYQAS